jgi:hypothetical protein
MRFRFGRTAGSVSSGLFFAWVVFLIAEVITSAAALGDTVEGPTFRAGLWRFDRTLEYPDHRVIVRQEGSTRCVDPTHAMKGTFSSPNIGTCRSERPERVDNRYTIANRCDYLGPVRTDITVHSDEAYTELNWIKTGNFPQVDRVLARRIGDCDATGAHGKREGRGAPNGSEASARRKAD